MAKIIAYDQLARQQLLNLLKHKYREYREREDYLGQVRKLLFQVEAQLRQTEFQQLEIFRDLAEQFKIPLAYPDLGDRVGMQEFFATNPFLITLRAYFAGRLSAEETYQKLMELKGETNGKD